jgi:DNA-binding NarL/FixJ family response regulator
VPSHATDRNRRDRKEGGTDSTPLNSLPTLTARQLEVLSHVARGRSNRQVGDALGISELTVRNHMRTIGQRLAATDRTHAVVLAIGRGWINIPIEPEPASPPVPQRSAVRGT